MEGIKRVESRLGGKLNVVNYENSKTENDFVCLESEKSDTEFKQEFVKIVYCGDDVNMDAYKGIVDTGATKTVAGRVWMEAFTEDSDWLEVPRYLENETFKFGNGPLYSSKVGHIIPVMIGKLKTELRVSVVEANVPLLLGLDFQKEYGIVIDTGKQTIYIKATDEEFDMSKNGNHWKLPLRKKRTMHSQAEKLVLHVEMEDLNEKDLRNQVQKVHKNLCHKSEKQMIKLFLMAGKLNKRTRNVIRDVVEQCQVCRKFKKTPPRPKVAMSKAVTTNQVVSLDLKEVRKEKKHILYCVDEFSGYIVAEVINNKEPETIFRTFDRRWVEQGPGIPKEGIFSDNGGEFKNPVMKEAAAQYGIKLSLTAANSPWSNGKNERNHYSVDRNIQKLMEENPNIKLEDAVSKAVYAHNIQINKTGFSPRQLVFGSQGVVPGITDGTPASMEQISDSDEIRRQFASRLEAEEIYRKIDSNERIKKAMTQQTYGYNDHKYYEGEEVFFKEEGKDKWSGPAKVTGQEGSKVRIIHAGYDRTVPACRVLPVNPEKVIVEEVEDVPRLEEGPALAQGLESQRGLDRGTVPTRGLESQGQQDERPGSSQGLESQRKLDRGTLTTRGLESQGRQDERPDSSQGLKSQRGLDEESEAARQLEYQGGLDSGARYDRRPVSESRLQKRPEASRGMEGQHRLAEGPQSARRLEAETIELNQPNVEMRPKRNQIIEFKVGGVMKIGKVSKVGKTTGKDKNRCWIKLRTGTKSEENYDFLKEVQSWKVVNKVTFDNQTIEKATTEHKAENDFHGIWFMNHKECCVEVYETPEDINKVFATNIPTKLHHHPEVLAAKEKELAKWTEFNAAQGVEYTGKEHVISSRWVITRKSDGSVKARLVVRGFEELEYPQSDSPTASNNLLKLFFALAANELMKIKSMDVTSAFLQGEPLKRKVYMEPPVERQQEGIIWKLNKSVYGLYDASRKWFQAVKPELLDLGMKTVSGDEAFFSMMKDGKLVGLCILHVDDFLVAGNSNFLRALDRKLNGRFKFGKVESNRFKFTGLNIEQQEYTILVDQIEFINGIKPIFSPRTGKKSSDEKLNKEEMKLYRGLTGQLSWAADNTRPDLAYDVRELATRNKYASLKDIQKANKVLKKAQKEQIKLKYKPLGPWRNLEIVTFTDSAYRNDEDATKSVGGRITFLRAGKRRCVPLAWKTIQQVCKSVKTAETRSLDFGVEDSLCLAKTVYEIYTGKREKQSGQIPVS